MSEPFTAADIENMRTAQGIHAYTDVAAYISAPTGLDEYGQPTTYAAEITMQCAFVDGGKMEHWREADIETLDAEVYFTALTPTKGGRIKVLKRFGVDVTNKTYEIVGIQDRGAYGWVCALKVATI